MGKRKQRDHLIDADVTIPGPDVKKAKSANGTKPQDPSKFETIQVVVGSYDRILHGLTATIKSANDVEFADTFLFNAHTSAIRCVAVSAPSAPVPGQTRKVLLASGSSDERINVYNLSAHPPNRRSQDLLAKVAPRPILENSKNRELGTLLHHSSTITALRFPTRSKLLSSGEDSVIAVTRTRDWSTLSTIKAPQAKPQGRPSGDTAPFGGTPSGINDFAIHPSMKLMISVSKGERCMRLWNLVTGKKAGVLNFDRDLMQDIGESRHSSGEGRAVIWGNVDASDEFAVVFDRDLVIFGMDSIPKCRVMPDSKVKIHRASYLSVTDDVTLLAVSTEDGRVAFFSTKDSDLSVPEKQSKGTPLKVAKAIGFIGGEASGISGRIKDFIILTSDTDLNVLFIIGASSDGKIRLWRTTSEELCREDNVASPKPMGKLLGTYETQSRVTCMVAYMMIPRSEDTEDTEDELEEEDDDEDEESDENDDQSESSE